MKTLVLITGTGRSGTSAMSGILHHLGLSVPGPYLGANESNPKGFYESRWAVKFHKRIAERAGINDFDGRPTALARAQSAITEADRRDLARFLGRFGDEAQVVVKDPRSVWTQHLWRDVAEASGRDIVYISMLRHPAEVVGSRLTYYADDSDEEKRTRYETFTVTRWVNGSLINERETRGQRRAFVRYVDLLNDWRAVAERLSSELGLALDLSSPDAAEVDGFIDPSLRRHQGTWDDLTVPTRLRQIAEAVWVSLASLAEGGSQNDVASAALDQQQLEFELLFREAAAVSHDATQQARADGFAAGKAAGRTEAVDAAATAVQAPVLGVEQLSGRALARELAARARRRVRSAIGRRR